MARDGNDIFVIKFIKENPYRHGEYLIIARPHLKRNGSKFMSYGFFDWLDTQERN